MLKTGRNDSVISVLKSAALAAFSLFINGLGIYLTIRANIGVSPWDVLTLGLSKTLRILYGSASISVSCIILLIDVLLKEPIGIAMFIDAFVVGKSVDFFNRLDLVPQCHSLLTAIPLMVLGLFIIAYTQYTYMMAELGCGPRDTLLVGLSKRIKRIPIGIISVILLGSVTFIGYLLGGPVGIGTLICAFAAGPIMQLVFRAVRFDATGIRHQHLDETLKTVYAELHGRN